MKENVDKHGFGEMDIWLIDKYLRHEGESLEDAKLRIEKEQKTREQINS